MLDNAIIANIYLIYLQRAGRRGAELVHYLVDIVYASCREAISVCCRLG